MHANLLPCRAAWLTALGLGLATVLPLRAYDELPPPEHVVLPAPRSPTESRDSISLASNLQVELVASEPLVMDPVFIAWGADGKLWVVEMADYPLGMDGKGKPGGRIKYLESTRGDGRYDKMTLFAEGLPFPNSILPWRNGVLVTAAPDILYLEDTNGDGKADKSEKWYTGIAEGNQQHRANGLQWGLDGWLTLCNGDSGGTVKSAKTGQVLELGRRDFRILPEAGLVEPEYGRSQFGRNRDDWGNWFGGNNSNPMWHYALDEHYLDRNRFLTPPNATIPIAKAPGVAPVYPTSLTAPRFNDAFGSNRFTSACSTMIYRDDVLGAGYAGNIFVCEPVHNLVNRQIVTPNGVTFTSDRAPTEQTSEFIASSDNWSRFCNIRTGPDGALYVVDMYRPIIEHPRWIPVAWQKEEAFKDLRLGSDKGRIYRISAKGRPLRSVPRLDNASEAALVEALASPNGTVRDLAQQQLTWRSAKSAAPALEKLSASATLPQVRAQALWSLETTGTLTPAVVARALKDPHAGVRRQALKLSDRFAATNPELLPMIIALADDADAPVRQQVAYSLGEWKSAEAGVALARLVSKTDDPLILAAAMSSALPHADTMIAQMNASGGANRMLIDLVLSTQNNKALGEMLTAMSAPGSATGTTRQFAAMAELTAGLRRTGTSLGKLRSSTDTALQASVDRTGALFSSARAVATSKTAPEADRIAAIALLGQGVDRQDEDFQTLGDLLAPPAPEAVQLAATNAIGQLNVPGIPARLLSGWDRYSPAMRGAALDVLTSRTQWTQPLLDRMSANRAMLDQIDPAHRSALLNYNDGATAARAAKLFNSHTGPDRQKVVDDYLTATKGLGGNIVRGRAVFMATCTACHQLGDAGGRAIGPDLAGLSDRSVAYLVPQILDPNRAVEDRYLLYTVATKDGKNLAGLLAAEAGDSITLVGIDGTEQVIPRSTIRTVTSTRRSLMPDGFEASVSPQGMVDLVAFIAAAGSAK